MNYKPRVEDEVKTEDTAILESLRGAGTTEELKNKIKHLEDQKRTVEQVFFFFFSRIYLYLFHLFPFFFFF